MLVICIVQNNKIKNERNGGIWSVRSSCRLRRGKNGGESVRFRWMKLKTEEESLHWSEAVKRKLLRDGWLDD